MMRTSRPNQMKQQPPSKPFLEHSRLRYHNITEHQFPDAQPLIEYMGAVQAQDYPMAKWAIGVRLPSATNASVEAALDAGKLVRTHVLRPTWHIVSGRDVRWMLALTGQHIKSSSFSRDRDLGIDAALYARTNDLIAKALEGRKNLTRAEVMTAIEKGGVETNASRAVHFMMNAELDAIVCNGVMRGKDQTYALMDEKVPKGLTLSREEAIAELAKRYFTSHAPATMHDFHWWSGLPMSDVRTGLESIKSHLQSFEHDGKTYFTPKDQATIMPQDSLFFLPAFDEYCVSYKSRDAVFRPEWQKEAITSNGIFKPIIVKNGQVIGIWKRTEKTKTVEVELRFFEKKNLPADAAIERSMAAFGAFLGKSVVLK
jgi:hypothetical protein